ncbi:MAG: PKD domain-containing protein, partial [Raineya sp.]
YTITLTVKDQAGCTDIVSKNITILANPAVSFNVPTNICAGVPVRFTSVASNATEFLWFFEGNGTSTEANPLVTFAQGGFYDVTLQVRNNNNCIATFTIENIEVLNAPNIIFNPQRVASNPLSIRFENFSSGATQFIWDFGDGNTSTLTNPTHTYSQAGEYVVKLTAISENGCQSILEQIVSVGRLNVDLAVLETRLENEKVIVKLENKGNTILNNIQIQVQIADTTFTEIYSPVILRNEQKEITLNLVIPENILEKAVFLCVKALPKPSVTDSNLTNNEACFNIIGKFVVFEPYPNPAQKEINLSFSAPNEGILNLHIQDMLGKTISKTFLISKGFNKETLNIENLAKGMYIFTFEFAGKTIHKKIIIQ